MDSSGQKSRPLDLKPGIKPMNIFHGNWKLKPMGESDGVLDPCVKGRSLFTLVHQGGAMGEGMGIHGQLRTEGVGDQSDVGVGMGGRVF